MAHMLNYLPKMPNVSQIKIFINHTEIFITLHFCKLNVSLWNFLRVNVRTCHIFDFFLIFFLMQGIVGIDRNNSGRNRGILLSSQGRKLRSKDPRFETLKNLNIDLNINQGSDQSGSFLFAEVNQKSKKIFIREVNQNFFLIFY